MASPHENFLAVHDAIDKALADAKRIAEEMTAIAHQKIEEAEEATRTAMAAISDLEKVAKAMQGAPLVAEAAPVLPRREPPVQRRIGVDTADLERRIREGTADPSQPDGHPANSDPSFGEQMEKIGGQPLGMGMYGFKGGERS